MSSCPASSGPLVEADRLPADSLASQATAAGLWKSATVPNCLVLVLQLRHEVGHSVSCVVSRAPVPGGQLASLRGWGADAAHSGLPLPGPAHSTEGSREVHREAAKCWVGSRRAGVSRNTAIGIKTHLSRVLASKMEPCKDFVDKTNHKPPASGTTGRRGSESHPSACTHLSDLCGGAMRRLLPYP